MSTRVDLNLHRDLKTFGATDVDACMNCGNCTATCSLSTEDTPFPRQMMHYIQIGNREKLTQMAEPWLCYYCGDCTESCPRDANPAETMMATRRFLTASYDWTGLGRKIYTSHVWEVGSVLVVALIVVLLFVFFHGPMVTSHVELNTFAPVGWIEFGDLVMGGLLTFFLLSNAWRMKSWIMKSSVMKAEPGLDVPLAAYAKGVPTFLVHLATQKRWRDHGVKRKWLRHFLLVTGYVTMLTMIVFFLPWFQTDKVHPVWHPQRLLGYYATVVLLYATTSMLIDRIKKSSEMHRFSRGTDWMFLILLWLTTVTGILVHILRVGGFPMATYVIYVVHLAILAPMLVVEVPFGKWSHLLYRPLAIYLTKVKAIAREMAAARAMAADRAREARAKASAA